MGIKCGWPPVDSVDPLTKVNPEVDFVSPLGGTLPYDLPVVVAVSDLLSADRPDSVPCVEINIGDPNGA